MSLSLDLDPGKGFVALPLSVMALDMSPGAFRTLAELCRMADRDGWCWPSLAQLGDRLGRSRATVSGYVSELRGLGLLETEDQRTANGYNYRLRYRVTFWQDWRRRFRRPAVAEPGAPVPAPSPERRVRPAERQSEAQNHIQENHARPAAGRSALSDLVREWGACAGSAPWPAFDRPPPAALVAATKAALAATGTAEDTPRPERPAAALLPALDRALRGAGQPLTPELRAAAAGPLARHSAIRLSDAKLTQGIQAAWRPHWRHPPSVAWLRRTLDALAAAHPEAAESRVLAGYLRRAEKVSAPLPERAPAGTTRQRTAAQVPPPGEFIRG